MIIKAVVANNFYRFSFYEYNVCIIGVSFVFKSGGSNKGRGRSSERSQRGALELRDRCMT